MDFCDFCLTEKEVHQFRKHNVCSSCIREFTEINWEKVATFLPLKTEKELFAHRILGAANRISTKEQKKED